MNTSDRSASHQGAGCGRWASLRNYDGLTGICNAVSPGFDGIPRYVFRGLSGRSTPVFSILPSFCRHHGFILRVSSKAASRLFRLLQRHLIMLKCWTYSQDFRRSFCILITLSLQWYLEMLAGFHRLCFHCLLEICTSIATSTNATISCSTPQLISRLIRIPHMHFWSSRATSILIVDD